MSAFKTRLSALIKKEFHQLWRDNSSLLIGVVLPLLLIFIIGFGISMDVKRVPTAVVLEDASPTAQDMLSFTNGSDYFVPHYVTSMREAEQLLCERKVEVIVRVPPDFTESLYAQRATVQVVLNGTDTTTATSVGNYIEMALGAWQERFVAKQGLSAPRVDVDVRMWFNAANSSTWYLIPGLLVLVTSIVGIFLTALVMAREWERGTLEAIFITPVKPLELLLAKLVPYFCISMVGFGICLLAARFIFEVPIHGSILALLVASMLYMFVALGIGLVISSITKNQFMACQLAIVVSLLPVLMLTGFLFDLRSLPPFVSVIGHVLPPTFYMELVKTLFLAGDNWPLYFKNCAILLAYACFFLGVAWKVTRKRLE